MASVRGPGTHHDLPFTLVTFIIILRSANSIQLKSYNHLTFQQYDEQTSSGMNYDSNLRNPEHPLNPIHESLFVEYFSFNYSI